MINPGVVAAIL